MAKIVHHLFNTDDNHVNEIEEKIFLVASDLFSKSATESIEIEDIIRRSKVSKDTFYKVFSSVDGLFKKLALRLTNEIVLNFLEHVPDPEDVVARVAFKSKKALLLLAKLPFLSRLLVKAEWPSSNPNHIMYRDIEKDLAEGIKQGCFSNVSASIGVNIVLGCLRGAARDLLEEKQPEQYIDQVTYQILISLGVDKKTAELIIKGLTSELPSLPSAGLFSNIMALQEHAKTEN